MVDETPLMSDGEIDIQPLISKLGHRVEEIRVRSLRNIIFKLDHDLICIGDVVHKKELFIKLLEWFNFDPCSNQTDVLQLLDKLSKHSSGLETLVSIGAIEFLSNFRQDADPSLYKLIDNILRNLLSLPEILDNDSEQELLHYKKGKSGLLQESTAELDIQVANTGQDNYPQVCQSFSDVENVRVVHLGDRAGEESQHVAVPIKFQDHDQQISEVEESKEESEYSWHYPWISLADSDRHILSTTNNRLESNNPTLVKNSCEFLNDVLFKDFLAEIFLQRPSIVKTLLTLLELKSLETSFLPLSAARCLLKLCIQLRQRYLFVSDPAWYSLHPDCWRHWLGNGLSSSSTAASPTSEISDLRTTGDGGERSRDSSKTGSDHLVEIEEDGLLRQVLEMNQMPLEEFGLQVLRGCCRLLNELSDPLVVLETLQEGLSLLEVCCPRTQWWNNQKMKPLRRDICRTAAKTLRNHMIKSGFQPPEGDSIVEHNIPRHAMTVTNTLLWLLNVLGPSLYVEWDDHVAAEDLGEVLRALLINEILFVTHPEVRTSLAPSPLVMDDFRFIEVYNKAMAVKESLVDSVKFFRKVTAKGVVNQDVLIHTLKSCLPSLPYHRHLQLINHSVTLISSVFERSLAGAETKSKAKEILLCLLSNVDGVVRRQAYERSVEVVKDALKISHVTNPTSSYCHKAMFMTDRDVLHVLCAFGMVDEDKEICECAAKIVETLLDNRLSMSGQLRKKLLGDISTCLPFLQMHLAKRTKLGTCLLGLLAPPGQSPHSLTADGEVVPFSQFERLRGSLRCMLLRDKMMRAKGYGYLMQRLVDEDSTMNRDFVYPSGSLENTCDLFIHETFASSVRVHRSTKHAKFDDEKIRKLFDIVATETTEVSLRKSSAKQLAVLMQDPEWHNVLLDVLAEDVLLRILEESLVKDGKVHISSVVNPKLQLVSPCLRILRLLSEYNVACRHKLAQNHRVYHLVVRHALLAPSGGSVRYEVSCVLTLLLFDEVSQCPSFEAQENNGGDIKFALPAIFPKRYSLPFNPPIHELKNAYQGEILQDDDPLRTEPVLSLFRVAWNIAWCDGAFNNIDSSSERQDGGVDEKLTWTSLDSQLLQCCSAKKAIPAAISSILTATSHHAVKSSVNKLSMHLLGDNCMKHNRPDDEGLQRPSARELFYSCDWKTAFQRYFTVYPKNADDDRLLGEVLRMFRYLIQDSRPGPPVSFLGWLAQVIIAPESPVSSLVSPSSSSTVPHVDASSSESKRTLRKELLDFLCVFVRNLRALSKPWFWSGQLIYAGDFTLNLTLNLNLTESPQYYDLPILESALQCLVEITAIPGFSTASKQVEPGELCKELLSSLIQVLTAFHAGRLGAFTSFMGRGVTSCVSLCLVHLVHEMSSVLRLQDWSSFFLVVPDQEDVPEVSWLSSMWTDHLPEVRWCSLAMATHVVSHNGSPLCLKQNIAGGLWNLALIVLLDGKECCLVRDQAACLFSILLSTLKRNEGLAEVETGLSVQTEEEIISGIPALHLLLDHHQFYSSFHQMLRNVVFENIPRLPGTTTFAESLTSSSSTRSKYGIPYQSLDTHSHRSDSSARRTPSESMKASSSSCSSRSEESARRLLDESSATSNISTSTAVSSRASSTIPLITRTTPPLDTGGDVRTSTPPGTVDSLEILAWVTPRFVGSLSGLVTNLVCVSPETVLNKVKDEDILGIFISNVDRNLVASLMSKLRNTTSPSRQRHLEINVIDTLDMIRQILVLLKTCAAKDPLVCHALQQNKAILEKFVELLAIESSAFSSDVETSCNKMWRSVVQLLLLLVQRVKGSPLLETPVEEIMLKHWKGFAAALRHVMALKGDDDIKTWFLHLLSHLLLRDGKRVTSGTSVTGLACLLDENAEEEEKGGSRLAEETAVHDRATKTPSGNGSELCRILLESCYERNIQDKNNHNLEDRHFITMALKHLLCISRTAKKTALQDGFLVRCMERIKQLHVHLNMESLEVGKAASTRKKEMDLIGEIVKIVELLKNLMFRSAETKAEAINRGLVSVLQQLWSWCTVVKTLLLAVLDLLCTLTAQCTQASIAMSNTSSASGSFVRLGPSNNTFVHCVVKMASKTSSKMLNNSTADGNITSCQLAFSLLKNLAMTSECRGILWKSNFVIEFSRLKSVSHQKWKTCHKTVVVLWLDLLANISFHRDGQQMIMKIEHAVPLLLEFCSSNVKRVSEAAVLILRNMCFHVPSKTLLLSNSEVVELLLRSVDKSSVYIRALAASGLWALLTNNQKAKSLLGKPALVVKRLSDSRHTLKTSAEGPGFNRKEEMQRQQYEDAIENILKILHCTV